MLQFGIAKLVNRAPITHVWLYFSDIVSMVNICQYLFINQLLTGEKNATNPCNWADDFPRCRTSRSTSPQSCATHTTCRRSQSRRKCPKGWPSPTPQIKCRQLAWNMAKMANSLVFCSGCKRKLAVSDIHGLDIQREQLQYKKIEMMIIATRQPHWNVGSKSHPSSLSPT